MTTPRADLARRKALAAAELDGHLARVSAVLGIRVAGHDVLDLPTSDGMIEEFAAKVAEVRADDSAGVRRTWPSAQWSRVAGQIAAIGNDDPERPVILLRRESAVCGVLVLPAGVVFGKAAELAAAEGGVLEVGTKDMSAGVRVGPATDDDARAAPQSVEVLAWGDDWTPWVG